MPQKEKNTKSERKLERFLEAQASVFIVHESLMEWCRTSLDGANDQLSYDLAKRIFKDLVEFESKFEEFEIEFWNYMTNVDNFREELSFHIIKKGFSDYKEYFNAKIEACISILNDVVVEFYANDYDIESLGTNLGSSLGSLESYLESLFDAAEDVIDIDLEGLVGGELSELMRKIPPQRIAPLEAVSTGHSLRRKIRGRFDSRVADKSILQAFFGLQDVLKDTCGDLRNSNCDHRMVKAFDKCLHEIDGDIDNFSPIKFGIYVGIANGFRDVVSDELGAFLSRQVISTLMQCDIFLKNFESWEEYASDVSSLTEGDSVSLLEDFRSISEDPIFEDDIRSALDDLIADKKDFGSLGKIDYAIYQSISNLLSETCRVGLHYLSSTSKKISSILVEVAGDGLKYAVGTIALVWVLNNSAMLMAMAENHKILAWLKPVIEFLKVHSGV